MVVTQKPNLNTNLLDLSENMVNRIIQHREAIG